MKRRTSPPNRTCPCRQELDIDNHTDPMCSTPPITSDRKPTQPTTRHSRRGRTGRERPDVEADVDEGGLRLQAATDRAACVEAPQQHQPPPPAKGSSPQLRPCTGKGASAGAGLLRRATRPAAGHARAPPPPPPAPPPQPHTTRPPPTTTGRRK